MAGKLQKTQKKEKKNSNWLILSKAMCADVLSIG